MLDKQQIRDADDVTQEQVLVPEWKGEVAVWSFTQKQRDEWEQRCVRQGAGTAQQNIRGLKLELVMLVVHTAEGELMFGAEDREWLGEKNAAAIDRIYQVAKRVCRLSNEDIEDLAENSSPGPSGGSSFD